MLKRNRHIPNPNNKTIPIPLDDKGFKEFIKILNELEGLNG